MATSPPTARTRSFVSYDLTLDNATAPVNSTIPNTVTLTKYAGENNGADHTATDLTDSAQVKTPPPAFAKALTGTEVTATGNGQFQAVIGEKVTYMLTVTVPEGLTPAAVINDTLDPGLAFVQLVSTTPSVGVTLASNPPSVAILDSGTARQVRFTLGDIQNNNSDNAVADTVTLVFEAIVLNQNTLPASPGNQSGTTLNNTAQFTATGVTAINSTPVQTVAIVEPALSLTKQIAPNNGGVPGTYADTLSSQDAGNVFFYKVVITHAGGPAAFDLGLTDAFSAKLTSLTIYSAASTLTTVGGTVRSLRRPISS